ncbi:MULTISPECIES: YesK family protein [Bacillus]|uniref:YesK family protein n=1 Tax=Bacillus TaxID=1386 RepID=UPI000AA62E89|nr:YesK family protein [Bacillus subtilis]MDX7994433.1 YesK family protein [Bacillus subtilis]WMW44717.1 YesK family protein [Bacillus subtilis]
MMTLWLMTAIFSVIIVGISLVFKKKKSSLQYGIPSVLMALSIILFIVSFIVGRWEGIGLGAISVSLLVSSVIALIVISI